MSDWHRAAVDHVSGALTFDVGVPVRLYGLHGQAAADGGPVVVIGPAGLTDVDAYLAGTGERQATAAAELDVTVVAGSDTLQGQSQAVVTADRVTDLLLSAGVRVVSSRPGVATLPGAAGPAPVMVIVASVEVTGVCVSD